MKPFIPFYLLLFCVCIHFSVSAQNKEAILQLHHNFKELSFTDFNAALKNANQAVLISEQLNDKFLLLQSYKNISEILYLKKENTEATKYHQKALELAIKTNNEKEFAALYNLWGSLEKRKNNFKEALQHYEKALLLAKKNDLKEEYNSIQNNLARLYLVLDDKHQALVILKNTIAKTQLEKDSLNLSNTYNILGGFYFEKKKDSALLFYERAYFLSKRIGNKYLQGVTASNLGYLHIYLENYKKALNHLNHAEQISHKIGNFSSLHYVNISLGIYYERIGNYTKAIEKYTKAIEDYGSYVEDAQKTKALWIVSGVFYHAKKYKDAYLYLDKYIALSEEVLALEKKKEFEKIRTAYEVEKKNNAIALLEKEKELANTHRKIIVGSGLLVSISLLLLVLFYKHRVKAQKIAREREKKIFKSEKENLEKTQKIKKIEGYLEGQEQEKNRIAKELHDGIGGSLVGVHHLLTTIESNIPNIKLEKIAKSITSITKEVRTLSHTLSSNYIQQQPFEMLLSDLKNEYDSARQMITISVFPAHCFNAISNEKKHHLYRITQELLQNITKHANAKNIGISFVKHKEYLSFIVEDDGVGFVIEKQAMGIGLENLKERVTTLKGKINIDSKTHKGTVISIEVPI